EPGVAGPARSRSGDRRSRARSGVAAAPARFARSRKREGPRALFARPQRGAAAIRDQPLVARKTGVVDERRADPGRAGSPRGRGRTASASAAVFVVRIAAVLDVSLPVSARDDLP